MCILQKIVCYFIQLESSSSSSLENFIIRRTPRSPTHKLTIHYSLNKSILMFLHHSLQPDPSASACAHGSQNTLHISQCWSSSKARKTWNHWKITLQHRPIQMVNIFFLSSLIRFYFLSKNFIVFQWEFSAFLASEWFIGKEKHKNLSVTSDQNQKNFRCVGFQFCRYFRLLKI